MTDRKVDDGWTIIILQSNGNRPEGFKKRPISNRQLTELQNYIPRCRRLLPDIRTDVTILGAEAAALLKGAVGYFGLMIEAPNYLLVSSEPHDYAMENAGYMGEDLVMKLTELESPGSKEPSPSGG